MLWQVERGEQPVYPQEAVARDDDVVTGIEPTAPPAFCERLGEHVEHVHPELGAEGGAPRCTHCARYTPPLRAVTVPPSAARA